MPLMSAATTAAAAVAACPARLATRLHFMFLLVVAGLALYLYFVYREFRAYDQTLTLLRQEVQLLKAKVALGGVSQVPGPAAASSSCMAALAAAAPSSAAACAPAACADDHAAACDDDDDADYEEDAPDDAASVTSHEIKEILTHIATDEPPAAPAAPPAVAAVKGHTLDLDLAAAAAADDDGSNDLATYALADLLKLKNDALKAYLRTRGVGNPKGTKEELASQIVALKNL